MSRNDGEQKGNKRLREESNNTEYMKCFDEVFVMRTRMRLLSLYIPDLHGSMSS
jgi:hypothetical protein